MSAADFQSPKRRRCVDELSKKPAVSKKNEVNVGDSKERKENEEEEEDGSVGGPLYLLPQYVIFIVIKIVVLLSLW